MSVRIVRGYSSRLNDAMLERGLTTAQLSKLSGIPNSTIKAYINDDLSPRIGDFVKLCEVLDKDIDYMLRGERK